MIPLKLSELPKSRIEEPFALTPPKSKRWSTLPREDRAYDIEEVMTRQRKFSPAIDMLMKLSFSETLDYNKAADYLGDLIQRGFAKDWLMYLSK